MDRGKRITAVTLGCILPRMPNLIGFCVLHLPASTSRLVVLQQYHLGTRLRKKLRMLF